MPVDKKTIRKVAGLARLELTEKELARFSRDVDEILSAFRTLQRIPTDGVKPTFQPTDIKNILRDDIVKPGIPRERALRNIRNTEDGYIRGPRVI